MRGPQRRRQRHRRRLFHHLLMAPLQRALALEHVDHAAVMVRHDLELDVPRASGSGARGRASGRRTRPAPRVWPGPRAPGRSAAAVTTFMPMPPPPADGFRRTGNPMRPAAASSAVVALIGGRFSRNHRHARALGQARALIFEPDERHGLGAGPDEDDARAGARRGELGVLGQEAVAGMDGVGPVCLAPRPAPRRWTGSFRPAPRRRRGRRGRPATCAAPARRRRSRWRSARWPARGRRG